MVIVTMALAVVMVMLVVVVMTAGAVMTMLMIVMVVAVGFAVVRQLTRQQLGDSGICLACAACIELDTGVIKRQLSTHTDAAADQRIRADDGKQAGQRAVARTIGIHDFGGDNSTIFYGIHLELRGVTEMLEDLTIFVCNSNFHINSLLDVFTLVLYPCS